MMLGLPCFVSSDPVAKGCMRVSGQEHLLWDPSLGSHFGSSSRAQEFGPLMSAPCPSEEMIYYTSRCSCGEGIMKYLCKVCSRVEIHFSLKVDVHILLCMWVNFLRQSSTHTLSHSNHTTHIYKRTPHSPNLKIRNPVAKSINFGTHPWVHILAPPLEVKSLCHSCLHHQLVRKENRKETSDVVVERE